MFFIGPLLVSGAIGTAYVRRSLPEKSVSLVVPGTAERAQLTRDGKGAVFIRSRTDAGAFFAAGFAHAQDRMWQMEVQRRLAQGRLSEVLGRGTIKEDAWMRTLGLYAAAKSSWSALGEPAKASLENYAAGVNAWLDAHPVLQPEFLLLGVKPEPWTPIDSLACGKLFALQLGGNFWRELANVAASQYLDKAQREDLLGMNSAAGSPLQGRLDRDELSRWLAMKRSIDPGGLINEGRLSIGSNAWAISGRFMSNGRPVLANDPHLLLQIPSPWYVADIRGDRLRVAGMMLVGLPIVVLGHNADIAWGATDMMADVQDLFFEQENPADPREYLHDGHWQLFETHTELIEQKADFPAGLRNPPAPVRVQVRRSRHGPIVSDVLGLTEHPVALRWTALEPGDASYESLLLLNYAHDWSSFKESFRAYVAPALNLLYADLRGNIGYLGVGRIPVRAKGDGQLPAPGWSDEYQWKGYIPFDELPQRYNPESGYLVSANQKNVDADYPYFISRDWAPEDRARRIEHLLQTTIRSGRALTLADIAAVQRDTTDLSALRLKEFLLTRIRGNGPKEQQALRYLAEWRGNMDLESRGAAIFIAWTKHLRERLFSDSLKGYWNRPDQTEALMRISTDASDDQIVRALGNPSGAWCSPAESDSRSCTLLLHRALEEALGELERLQGSSLSSWTWGNVHAALYAHTPFSRIDAMAPLFERRIANGGSSNTINLADGRYVDSKGYEQTVGPTFRHIMQAGEKGWNYYYMNSTGQSGNPLSQHYDDMVRPFRDGLYYELPVSSNTSPDVSASVQPE